MSMLLHSGTEERDENFIMKWLQIGLLLIEPGMAFWPTQLFSNLQPTREKRVADTCIPRQTCMHISGLDLHQPTCNSQRHQHFPQGHSFTSTSAALQVQLLPSDACRVKQEDSQAYH